MCALRFGGFDRRTPHDVVLCVDKVWEFPARGNNDQVRCVDSGREKDA